MYRPSLCRMPAATHSCQSRTGRVRADSGAPSCNSCSVGPSACRPTRPQRTAWFPDSYRACRRTGSFLRCKPYRLLPFQDHGAAAMARAKRAAGAVRDRQIAVGDLNFRMRFATKLANGLDDLGDAATIGRMVGAQPAAIRVERQLANAGDQVAVGNELAALALLTEPK